MCSKILSNIFGDENITNGETRLAIVKQMASLSVTKDVSEAELDIIKMVFSEFYNDKLMSIRLEVAKAVCCADFISRHLILKIAEDCASISQFVLQFSNKLSSVDLIEHVIYGNAMKQIAISSRLDLSNEIVVSLIEHGNSEVINSLVSNSAAQITAHDFRQIYINFANEASLRELLCKRDDISADLRELIAFDVAKELEIFVINANWLNKKQAANAAKKSYEIAVIQISDRISGAEMADYIQKLSEEERLTPSIILRSITTGYMKFFEYALAYLAGVPIQKLHSLLHATNPLARQALFSRSKLPADLFPILTIAIDVYGTMNQKFANDSNQNKNDFSIKMIQNITESYHAQNHINQAYLQRVLDCYYIDISGKIAA